MQRRDLLKAGAFVALSGCHRQEARPKPKPVVLSVEALSFPWKTSDPFLFCAYHADAYPAGNDELGPDKQLLRGRNIGRDFKIRDGWRMYHGDTVPGFPQHPHRGFETVSIVRQGLVDHADSLGATARYGQGDVQWMTAGRGIVHAEMFPLLRRGESNPLEMFQIWLNLPAKNKLVEPHFHMMWAPSIPQHAALDGAGNKTIVTTIAGQTAPAPPPSSWAASASHAVTIATLKLDPGARYTLPKVAAGANRTAYFFRGGQLTVGERTLTAHAMVRLVADVEVPLFAGAASSNPDGAELLLLSGMPIGEPVAQHGPFVMNTEAEIRQAYADYRATQFGGWPWPANDPVHKRDRGRFAKHVDGKHEEPT